MRTVALVPIKALTAAKSRLAAALDPAARAALTLRALGNVLAALDTPGIAARVVVTPDAAVLRAAEAAGATGLRQEGEGLNEGLAQGRVWAVAAGAEALLIVLGDLPLLARADVDAILDLADRPGVAVFAPDRHGAGTNALLLRPPDALPFAFGVGSLARPRPRRGVWPAAALVRRARHRARPRHPRRSRRARRDPGRDSGPMRCRDAYGDAAPHPYLEAGGREAGAPMDTIAREDRPHPDHHTARRAGALFLTLVFLALVAPGMVGTPGRATGGA